MRGADLRAWQSRHGYTYNTAAEALGMSRATYARYLSSPEVLPRWFALACAAIDAGLAVA
ncbi:helix-turn-helix domain-containing protein [Delftia acidovorans]|uniref:helix-turn-helix domain-containing protein n=1 Tax=Delftia acidovorans TaxID=80866 RepID=UPI003D0C416A